MQLQLIAAGIGGYGFVVRSDCRFVNRLVQIIARPAGDLLEAVGAIRQVLGGALAVFADGNHVALRILGLIVAASGFQPYAENGSVLRLLGSRNLIPGALADLDSPGNNLIRYRQGNVIVRLEIVAVAGFQGIDRSIQLIAYGGLGLLQGVNRITLRAGVRIRGKAAVLNGVALYGGAIPVEGVFRAVQGGIALGSCAVRIDFGNGGMPILIGVGEADGLRASSAGCAVCGNGHSFCTDRKIGIAGVQLLHSVGAHIDAGKGRHAGGIGAHGHIHILSDGGGAVEPKLKALETSIVYGFLYRQPTRQGRVRKRNGAGAAGL